MKKEKLNPSIEFFKKNYCDTCGHPYCNGTSEQMKECSYWQKYTSEIDSKSISPTDKTIIHPTEENAPERKKNTKTFTIDFDNTCALEVFPGVGEDVVGAVEVLKKMQDYGHRLILWTCRCGNQLDLAKKWFEIKGINLTTVNDFYYDDRNLELIRDYGCPRKVIGNYNIDDKNFGCPITTQYGNNGQIYDVVDWYEILKILKEKSLL